MAEPHDSDSPITPEDSREELRTEFDMTPPPVPSVRRPTPKSTTPSLDFLRPGEAPGELGRLGGYRILKVLGTGGMGVVFQAEDPSLKRFVALKVMKPLLAVHDNARKRFTREAQSAAAVTHDHVVRIYQVGEDHGVPFLAMELLEGEPLDTRLRREKTLPLLEVLRIGREVASGLAAAHRRGLVHRDIKPANILLEPLDPTLHGERSGSMTTTSTSIGEKREGEAPAKPQTAEKSGSAGASPSRNQTSDSVVPTTVKIVDFGLARATEGDSELTQSGHVTGTPQYMSPEQAEGHDVDHRSDLFSLGCVMYRMLCGETPFSGRSSSALLLAIAERPHKPITDHRTDVPPRVEAVINRLLAKSPNDRFQTAIELVQTLAELERRLLAGKPLDGDSSSPELAMVSNEQTASMTVHDLRPARPEHQASPFNNKFAIVALALMLVGGAVISWSRWRHAEAPDVAPVASANKSNQVAAKDSVAKDSVTVVEPVIEKPSESVASNTKPEVMPAKKADEAAPLVASEPPPLEEWLKGRTILTVSRDGKSQFNTIQAALDALKPGQVVEVLDAGPYDENLRVMSAVPNTGLISRVNTLMQAPREPDLRGSVAHHLEDLDGFRLHGFAFRDPAYQSPDVRGQLLRCFAIGDITIENCLLIATWPSERWELKGVFHVKTDGPQGRVTLRDCWISGRGYLSESRGTILVKRNCFAKYPTFPLVVTNMWSQAKIDIVQNVFHEGPGVYWDAAAAAVERFSLRSNSFVGGSTTLGIANQIVRSRLQFDRNLTTGHLHFEDVAQKRIIPESWKRADNLYLDQGRPFPENYEPPTNQDHVVSKDDVTLVTAPDSRDYARIIQSSPIVSKKLSDDVGALPLGRAPAGGDWLTRLQDRVTSARANYERSVAEWMLSLGGTVKVRSEGRLISVVMQKDLPTTSFVIEAATIPFGQVTDDDMKKVAGLSGLKDIELHHSGITDKGLSYLRGIKSLIRLHLEGTKITDAGLDFLTQNRNMANLYLSRSGVTGAAFLTLKEFPHLWDVAVGHVAYGDSSPEQREALLTHPGLLGVELDASWINPDVIARLANQSNIRRLKISGDIIDEQLKLMASLKQIEAVMLSNNSRLTPSGIDAFRELPKLTFFAWETAPITGEHLAHVATLTQLRSMHLADAPITDAAVNQLRKMPSVETFNLSSTQVTPAGLADLQAAWPKCRFTTDIKANDKPTRPVVADIERDVAEWVLSIGGTVHVSLNNQDMQVAQAEKLPQGKFVVTQIELAGNSRVSNDDLKRLSNLRSLIFLDLDNTQITDDGIVHLATVSSLERLFLHSTQIGDGAMKSLAKLPNLNFLHLEGTNVSDEGIQQLGSLPRLKFIHLGKTKITKVAVPIIVKQFVNLESLSLSDLPLGDNDLEALSLHSSLNYLNASRTKVTDRCIEHFVSLTNLTHLYLQQTEITDAAISRFVGMNSLKRLIVVETKVTEDGLRKLAEAKPNLQIVSSRYRAGAEFCFGDGRTAVLTIVTPTNETIVVREAASLPRGPFSVLSADLSSTRTLGSGTLFFIARLTDLSELILRDSNVFGADLKNLPTFTQLKVLDLSGTQVTDQHMEPVMQVKTLKRLDLSRTAVTKEMIQKLAAALPDCEIIPSPRLAADVERDVAEWVLSIGGTIRIAINNQDMQVAQIEKLPQGKFSITQIELSHNPRVTNDDMKRLSNLPKLFFLDVNNTEIADRGLAHLETSKSLEWLYLHGTQSSDLGMASLAKLKQLRFLHLQGTLVTNEGLQRLGMLPNLSMLHIGEIPVTGRAIELIAHQFPSIAILHVSNLPLTDSDVSPLSQLAKLQQLDLSQTQITDKGLQPLLALPELTRLDLAQTAITDAAIERFAAMKSLKRVTVVETKITENGVRELMAKRPDLEVVFSSYRGAAEFSLEKKATLTIRTSDEEAIAVRDAKLLPRGSFTVLKVDLSGSQAFGSGTLSFIARLTDMSELILRDSNVFGADMKALNYLTQLKVLDLSGTQVTDQHMEPVMLVKTLKRMDLSRTAVSKSMIEQIKVALPECEVISP